jgi:hypothetical protein
VEEDPRGLARVPASLLSGGALATFTLLVIVGHTRFGAAFGSWLGGSDRESILWFAGIETALLLAFVIVRGRTVGDVATALLAGIRSCEEKGDAIHAVAVAPWIERVERLRWPARVALALLVLVGTYFPVHALSLDVTPAWRNDDGVLLNPAVHLVETGELRFPIFLRTVDDRPQRPMGALHFVGLAAWMKIAGTSALQGRVYALLVTFAIIVILADMSRRLGGWLAAMATALLLCGSIYFHLLARTIRPEPTMIFWQCVAFWAVIRATTGSRAAPWWCLSAAAASTCFLSHLAGVWVSATIGLLLVIHYRGRWHRSLGFWGATGLLLIPPLLYLAWLGAEDRQLLLKLMGWYSKIGGEVASQRSGGTLLQLVDGIRRDFVARVPWVERGATAFALTVPASVAWWNRLWLLAGLVVPALLWWSHRSSTSEKFPAGALFALALATWISILFQFAYPNKHSDYLPAPMAFLYCGAGIAAGRVLERRRALVLPFVLLALVPNGVYVDHFLVASRTDTPFTSYGAAIDAVTPAGAGLYGFGTWWRWLHPRPFTTTSLFAMRDRPPDEVSRLNRSVRCLPETEYWTLDEYLKKPNHHRLFDPARLQAAIDDSLAREPLAYVIGRPYGTTAVLAPAHRAPTLPRPNPRAVVFHEGRGYLLIRDGATREQAPLLSSTAHVGSFVVTGPGAARLVLPPGPPADLRISAPSSDRKGPIGILVTLEATGAWVRYGYLENEDDPQSWEEPPLTLPIAVRPHTIAWIDPGEGPRRAFSLSVHPLPDAEGGVSTVRILEAVVLDAAPIDLHALAPGSLLDPSWAAFR